MNLSDAGADLLGSSEASALRVLARVREPLSGRDVARRAEISPSTMRRALERLGRIGVVSARPARHATLYQVNRDHEMWAGIESILAAPARVESEVARLVEQTMGDRATVALFGSVARGDSTSSSDVDIALVIADDVGADERDALVDDLTSLVESRAGSAAQVVTLSREQFALMADHGDPPIESWHREAVVLSGPPLASLSGEGTLHAGSAG